MNIQKIKSNLNTQIIGTEIQYFDIINSTNDYLKNQRLKKNGLVVIAENQTQGRGRGERKWLSQPGKNLTFSILLIPEDKEINLGILPIISASALAIAIEESTNILINTKWPNDLLVNNKKLGGILIESVFSNNLKQIIVGIGLNVNQKYFNDDLKSIATSLFLETEKEYDRELILSYMLNSYDIMYKKFTVNDYSYYLYDWKRRCNHFGKFINFEQSGNLMRGIAKDLNPDGSLTVDIGEKVINIYSGEIILIK